MLPDSRLTLNKTDGCLLGIRARSSSHVTCAGCSACRPLLPASLSCISMQPHYHPLSSTVIQAVRDRHELASDQVIACILHSAFATLPNFHEPSFGQDRQSFSFPCNRILCRGECDVFSMFRGLLSVSILRNSPYHAGYCRWPEVLVAPIRMPTNPLQHANFFDNCHDAGAASDSHGLAVCCTTTILT